MKYIEITLPFPPSVNRYWRSVVIKGFARILLSADGRRFKDSCKKIISQRLEKIQQAGHSLPLFSKKEKLAVEIELYPPTKRVCDVDNYAKATLDALTASGVWGDDSQVDDLRIIRREVVRGGHVLVKVYEASKSTRRLPLLDDCPF